MKQLLKRLLAEADLDEIWAYIAEDSPELYDQRDPLALHPILYLET